MREKARISAKALKISFVYLCISDFICNFALRLIETLKETQ